MGEKVYVSGEEARPSTSPHPVHPLNYAPPDRIIRQFGAHAAKVLRCAGGWQQLVFAVGLATTLAAFAYGLTSHVDRDETAVFAFMGGLLIGVVIRVPLRREE